MILETKNWKLKTVSPAFTLIELLVTIAVIGILMTLIGFSVSSAIQRAKAARAQAELRELINAAKLYRMNHPTGKWPKDWDGANDVPVTEGLLAPLIDGNEGLVYLELPPGALVGGLYVDPWGEPYRITVKSPGEDNEMYTDTFHSTTFIPMRNRRIPTP